MATTDKDVTLQNAHKNISPTTTGFWPELLELDRRILQLIYARVACLHQWRADAEQGKAEAIPPVRVQVNQANTLWMDGDNHGMSPEQISQIFQAIVGGTSHTVSTTPAVAYLGPMYSYSYLAALRYFSTAADLSPVGTIAAVFDEIRTERANFGVVPIENSTDGRIVDTLTMFAKYPIRICGEVLLPIHHCLLGRCARSEIEEVYSKPQALSQCRHWLSQHLPDARLIEISSTTAAAKLAAEKPRVAAIASLEAGLHYELNVIQSNIEDNQDNVTRFAILGNQSQSPTGCDKTSIMFQIPHRSGALAEAMQLFSQHALNMTWIESFPIPGNSKEYLFFIEFEGHQADGQVQKALHELAKQTLRLEVLGSYPRAKLIAA